MGFPGDSVVKKPPAVQKIEKPKFDLWVGKIPWRRKWQPTPVFLPRKSHGQRTWQSLDHGITNESDIAEQLNSNNKQN